MSAQNWAQHIPSGQGQPQSTGWRKPKIRYRDPLDAARSGAANPAGESHPNGYLDIVNGGSRREERLLEAITRRASSRNYQRGIHAGSRANPSSYFWPDEMRPEVGLERQATSGLRHTPLLQFDEAVNSRLTNDGKIGPRDFQAGGGASYAQFANVFSIR